MLKKIVLLTSLVCLNIEATSPNSGLSSTDMKKLSLVYAAPALINICLACANFSKGWNYYFAIKGGWLALTSAACYAVALKKEAQEKSIDKLSTFSPQQPTRIPDTFLIGGVALSLPFIEIVGLIGVLVNAITKK